MISTRSPTARAAGSCRQCRISCERLVYPAGCVSSGCDRLYSHERRGRTLVGCLEGVFAVEIDLDGLHALQRTALGFGGLRAARPPLPMCQSEVERTFEHRSDGPCVNPDFLLARPGETYPVTVTAEAPPD